MKVAAISRTGKKEVAVHKAVVRDTFLDFILEQLSPLGSVTVKRMFGGKTLFCDEVAFGLIDDNVLYLKADDVNRPAFEALGIKPFKPFKDKPEVMQYYSPPAKAFDDSSDLLHWCRQAVQAGQRAADKKNKKRVK